jgi:hypothetical protein
LFIRDKKRNAEAAEKSSIAHNQRKILVRGGFGGGVHAVLGDFVDAAGGRFNALTVEMIERDAAFADGIALFDGFGDVGFGKRGGFEKSAAGG